MVKQENESLYKKDKSSFTFQVNVRIDLLSSPNVYGSVGIGLTKYIGHSDFLVRFIRSVGQYRI